MRVALLGAKGGTGRSIAAWVLAHGLVLEGHEVTLLEVLSPGRRPADPETKPPFGYLPISLESIDALAERIGSTAKSGVLVLDLPALPAEESAKILPALTLAIVPVHPSPFDLAAARSLLDELNQFLPAREACPRWVLHVDVAQSLRGSLSLMEDLVRGWKPESLPPFVMPWTLPWFSRPDLRALVSGAVVSGNLAAASQILAIMALRITEGASEDLLFPGSLEERLPVALIGPYRGEDRPMHEKFLGLAADLAAIHAGEGPLPTDLLGAPILHSWQEESFQAALLTGIVGGHPRLGTGRPVQTSQAVIINERAGWARTVSRYYRLGRKLRSPQLPRAVPET